MTQAKYWLLYWKQQRIQFIWKWTNGAWNIGTVYSHVYPSLKGLHENYATHIILTWRQISKIILQRPDVPGSSFLWCNFPHCVLCLRKKNPVIQPLLQIRKYHRIQRSWIWNHLSIVCKGLLSTLPSNITKALNTSKSFKLRFGPYGTFLACMHSHAYMHTGMHVCTYMYICTYMLIYPHIHILWIIMISKSKMLIFTLGRSMALLTLIKMQIIGHFTPLWRSPFSHKHVSLLTYPKCLSIETILLL